VNDGLINVLILLAVGAGSLLQWWLKKQRAARPEARAADPPPVPAGGSLEDMLSELFGGEPKARPAMDWRPISAPQPRAQITVVSAAAADAAAAKAERDTVPQRRVTDTVALGQTGSADSQTTAGNVVIGALASADLRRAFIMKELLDPPVSLR